MLARTRVTITLPTILREQAQIVAAERGDSVSGVVRLALQQYLEKTRKEREGLTALYAEFADEDRQLAEAGLQNYAVILAEEEASHEKRAADTLTAWQQVY
jgi:metal-responsive CopG/Arc/MetJ family transcriptional regulator